MKGISGKDWLAELSSHSRSINPNLKSASIISGFPVSKLSKSRRTSAESRSTRDFAGFTNSIPSIWSLPKGVRRADSALAFQPTARAAKGRVTPRNTLGSKSNVKITPKSPRITVPINLKKPPNFIFSIMPHDPPLPQSLPTDKNSPLYRNSLNSNRCTACFLPYSSRLLWS